ncbi:hypothetical protein AX769_04870 [Frondihabitans sp. PAMC 28766]|uniref:MFS transporter n=1 Tax=Frondihabitans sp. PAMC 28766 TaxID=1795630 RepID=UPI00078B2131|nr:MFS transporter [Frondihabitans sp. PAMC 28766]AMM19594.1 hypothetical protein AX769_04870 [Frondihabitans sp. PAMC 28766]
MSELAVLARIAPFRWLALGTAISRLGSSIAPVALAFAVLDLTHSAASLGLVVGARSAATLVFLLIGGTLADRVPRGILLAGSSVASAVTQAIVGVTLLGHAETVPLLAGMSALNGAFSALSGPAAAGLVPLTVSTELLPSANAVSRLLSNAASVVGLAFAGIVVALIGSGGAIVVDAITFGVGAGCFALLRLDRSVRTTRAGFVRELLAGWTAFAERRWVWATVAAFFLANAAFVGGIVVLGPTYADATIGRGAWGFFLAAEAVGYVAGGFIALRVRPRRYLAVGLVCAMAWSLPLFALAAHAPLPVLLAASFAGGLGVEQFGVAWSTSLQEHVPIGLLSRVSSYDQLGSFLAIPIGQVLAGPVSLRLGLPVTLGAAGLLLVVALAGALCFAEVRGLRTTTREKTATG